MGAAGRRVDAMRRTEPECAREPSLAPRHSSLEGSPRGERVGVRGNSPSPPRGEGWGEGILCVGPGMPLTPTLPPHGEVRDGTWCGAREGWAASRVRLPTESCSPLTELTLQFGNTLSFSCENIASAPPRVSWRRITQVATKFAIKSRPHRVGDVSDQGFDRPFGAGNPRARIKASMPASRPRNAR
jgi:hypothetical protein